jgi:hypothetical protein
VDITLEDSVTIFSKEEEEEEEEERKETMNKQWVIKECVND